MQNNWEADKVKITFAGEYKLTVTHSIDTDKVKFKKFKKRLIEITGEELLADINDWDQFIKLLEYGRYNKDLCRDLINSEEFKLKEEWSEETEFSVGITHD